MRLHLEAIMTHCHRLAARACDPYRPERHYMRGPGPKWHARHRAEGQSFSGSD